MEELLRILFKWMKPIGLVCLVATIGSVIISFLLPHYFTSTAVFMTINPLLMERTTIFSVEGSETPVYRFGGEGDIDRIISLMETSDVEDYIIEKFNLYEHYDFDKNKPSELYYLKEKFRGLVTATKTPERTIHVEVTDKDRNVAANMANSIMKRLDVLNKKLLTEKNKDVLKLYEVELKEKKKEMNELRDSLNNYIVNFTKDTVTINILSRTVKNVNGEYNSMQTLYKQQKATMEQDYSTITVVDKAVPAVRRSWPVRSFLVLGTLLATFILMTIFAIIMEKFKEFKLSNKA